MRSADLTIKPGFVLRRGIFDDIEKGEDLVVGPFERLLREGLFMGYRVDRFGCMDPLGKHRRLTRLPERDDAPLEDRRDARPEGVADAG